MSRTLPVIVAASLALGTVLLVPSAVDANEPAPGADQADAKNKRKRRGQRKFPMKGDAFVARIDARLQRIEAKLEKRIAKKRLNPTAAQEVRTAFEKHATTVREAARRAAQNGEVTRQEAKGVKQLAKAARADIRAKLGLPPKNDKRRRARKGGGA